MASDKREKKTGQRVRGQPRSSSDFGTKPRSSSEGVVPEHKQKIFNKTKSDSEKQQLNDTGLFKILREGRKYGIYSVVSTQSPLDIPAQLSGQFGSVLIHQLNHPDELQQIVSLENIVDYHNLSVGQAILKMYRNPNTMLVDVTKPTTKHDTASPKFR